jgi:hypothetical protein
MTDAGQLDTGSRKFWLIQRFTPEEVQKSHLYHLLKHTFSKLIRPERLNTTYRNRTTVFKLLARKNQPLLVGRDSLLVLNLAHHLVDRVRPLRRYTLACQHLEESACRADEEQDSESSPFGCRSPQCPTVLQMLATANQPLLVRWGDLLVINLALHHFDRVRRIHLDGDGLPGQRLDDHLHDNANLLVCHEFCPPGGPRPRHLGPAVVNLRDGRGRPLTSSSRCGDVRRPALPCHELLSAGQRCVQILSCSTRHSPTRDSDRD